MRRQSMLYVITRSRCQSLNLSYLSDCGDESDVTKSGFGLTAETECDNVCTGDPAHLCGGVFRIQYYLWTGPAHVWHTPAITGRYEVSCICLSFEFPLDARISFSVGPIFLFHLIPYTHTLYGFL